jgi:hypothetical protein
MYEEGWLKAELTLSKLLKVTTRILIHIIGYVFKPELRSLTKVNLSPCLTKFHIMKTHPVLKHHTL